VLIRTLDGLHTSEQSALLATLFATLIGVAIGGVSGYRGGSTDAMLMRFADMLGVFPALLLLLAAYAYFTPVTVSKATAAERERHDHHRGHDAARPGDHLEATVEFFGLGVPAEIQPTLGNLIGDGQRNVLELGWGWWTWAGPAVLLVVILMCANLLGDAVADALRPARAR
jgi:peptide/nickel transport system permease protein